MIATTARFGILFSLLSQSVWAVDLVPASHGNIRGQGVSITSVAFFVPAIVRPTLTFSLVDFLLIAPTARRGESPPDRLELHRVSHAASTQSMRTRNHGRILSRYHQPESVLSVHRKRGTGTVGRMPHWPHLEGTPRQCGHL